MSAQRRAKPAGGPGSLIWAQGLACGRVLVLAPALAVLLAMLFWPVVVAFARDKAPGRPSARGVALCIAAASVGPIRSAWTGGVSLGAARGLATDPHLLTVAWCAGGAGWLLTELAPLGARAALEAASRARTARLKAERSRLLALWGWEESADPEL
jgi:hypothetical protein